MKELNLHELYPDVYHSDYMVNVSDEVFEAILQSDRQQAASRRRMYYHRAYYSLDLILGSEYNVLLLSDCLYEQYERTLTIRQVHAALNTLPAVQSRRIRARFLAGISARTIAEREGVTVAAVNISIRRGLHRMRKFFEQQD